MKFSLSLLSICILSFILIYSCSTEEEESVAPVVQTPQPQPEPENETQEETSNETVEVDTDGDGVIDSLDDFPLNSNLTEDLWGQIVDFEPELFFANDISQNAQEQFRRDINLGITEWGNYGPLEYWILGNDINAALELAELYCERRSARGELWYFDGSLPISELESICLSEKCIPTPI